jgi:hypothetical protein
MNADEFYQRIREHLHQPPLERHAALAQLHTEIVTEYLMAIRGITDEEAARPVQLGTETRNLAQVVGHIAEWERFTILSAGDMLADLRHPRMVTSLDGYVEPDGRVVSFASVDEFNAYQAAKHADCTWPQIQEMALATAATLHILFTHPHLLSAERLERTLPFRKRLPDGTKIENVALGWILWTIVLEHEAVEHAAELGMNKP